MLEQWKTKLKALAKTYGFILFAVLFPLGLVLAFSNFGPYINSYLFYQPIYKLESFLDLQPKLDQQIRLILLEDRSLQRLGRDVHFGEWQKIAKLLFNEGYEKVFLHGFHSLPSEIGDLSEIHDKGEFIVGCVDLNDDRNIRAIPADKIPANLLLGTVDQQISGFEPTKFILGPTSNTWSWINRLGNLQLDANNYMAVATVVNSNKLLPNFALWVGNGLTWQNGKLINANGEIPISSDGQFYIDFVNKQSIYANSVSVASFFSSKAEKRVKDKITGKLLSRLKGGRIAVLVPDSHTGSKFIDSPLGKVPSFFATISLMNNTLHHTFHYRPLPHWQIIFLTFPLIFWLLSLKGASRSIICSSAFGFAILLTGVGLLNTLGFILPCAELFLLTALGIIIRATDHQLRTLTEKIRLNNDLKMGSLVQTLLMPKDHSGVAGNWKYHVVYHPYGHMSGDWLQIYHSPEGSADPCAIVAIGDVVGKGPSAALITAAIASVWNNFVPQWDRGQINIVEFINSLDRTIFQIFRGQQNTTLALAHLTSEQTVLYTCSASSWIRIIPATGKAKGITFTPQDPVGVLPKERNIKGVNIKPEPSEFFLTYTDGVIDGSSGKRRFIKTVESEANDGTIKDFDYYANTAIREGKKDVLPDDVTLILVQWQGSASSSTDSSEYTAPDAASKLAAS